jgi:hypothetical protein
MMMETNLITEKKQRKPMSPEHKAKIAAAHRAKFNDPAYKAMHKARSAAANKKWHSNPENAAKFAQCSSERMKKRHAENNWKAEGGRSGISSRGIKKALDTHKEMYREMAKDRYAAGLGINSDTAKSAKVAAGKWIMKAANEALHSETNYNEVYREAHLRLRREMPYDGPSDGADYHEYIKKLGTATVNSPECRKVADDFMRVAIPRFAKKWQEQKR